MTGAAPGRDPEDAPHFLSPLQKVLVTAGLMLGTSLAALDLLIIATALTDIASDLGSLSDSAWIFTSYLLGHTLSVTIWGKFGDLFGRGRTFTVAVLAFVAASALAGASTSIAMLVGARFLQGLAAGGLVALSHGILGDFVPVRQRGPYLAVLTSVWTIASLLGPLLGGLLVDSVGWRWIFYMNLPWGAVAILLVSPTRKFSTAAASKPKTGYEPENGHETKIYYKPEIDYRGSALLMAGLGLVTIGASLANDRWLIFGACLVAGSTLLIWFTRTQLTATEPILPLSMFSHKVVRVASLSVFLFGMANFGSAILIPLFAQLVNGVSATAAGYTLAPVPVGILCSTTVVGWLIRRTGKYRFYPALGSLIFAIGVLALLTMTPETTRPEAMSYAFVAGIGNGMIQPVITIAIQNSVPYKNLGAGTALAISARSMGQTFGTIVIGVVLSARTATELAGINLGGVTPEELVDSPELIDTFTAPIRKAVVEAYHAALDTTFWVMVMFAGLSMVAALRLPGKQLRS